MTDEEIAKELGPYWSQWIDHWKARAEAAEYEAKRWKDVAEKQASWETLWAEQVDRAEAANTRAEAAEERVRELEIAVDAYAHGPPAESQQLRGALNRIKELEAELGIQEGMPR